MANERCKYCNEPVYRNHSHRCSKQDRVFDADDWADFAIDVADMLIDKAVTDPKPEKSTTSLVDDIYGGGGSTFGKIADAVTDAFDDGPDVDFD